MKAGYKTTEFWIVLSVILYALALATGVLKPSHISGAAQNIKEGTDALPSLVDAVKNLIDKYSELLVMGGLAWAYLKKRSKEKIAVANQPKIESVAASPVDVMAAVKVAIKELSAAKKVAPTGNPNETK